MKLIDIATAHANHLGIGNPDMPNDHTGWVLSRLTIEMERYPKVDTDYTITTWVVSYNRHFSERAFAVSDAEGRTLGYARSIWMVLDTVTHANFGLDSLPLSPDLASERECPIPRQGKHILILPAGEDDGTAKKSLQATSPAIRHTFSYCDLDAYRHVNTVRYIQLLMNQFSLAEHDAKFVKRLEVSFLDEGQYGSPIEILRHDAPEGPTSFYLRRCDDGAAVQYARVYLEERK